MGWQLVEWLPSIFYRILLYIIHTVVRYGLLGWAFFDEFKRFYVSHSTKWRRDISYMYIKRSSETLSRLPKHVGFVFTEDEEPDYSDIANITIWTIAMGIPYITLYERTGKFLMVDKHIVENIEKRLERLLGSHSKAINLVVNNTEKKHENGFAHMQHVYLNIISEDDGVEDIARTTKALSNSCISGEMKSSEINEEAVERNIAALKGIPDPDVILQFGDIQCLSGFLPWHTRLSEIIWINSSRRISFDTFFSTLQRFSSCQQRFGK